VLEVLDDPPDLNDIFRPDSDFLAVDLEAVLFEAVARLERVAVLLRRAVEVDFFAVVAVLAVGLEAVLSVSAVALSEDVVVLADGLVVFVFASVEPVVVDASVVLAGSVDVDASVFPIAEPVDVPLLFQ